MILIDSEVIIWILRGRSDIREKMENFLGDIKQKLFITPIQISEIYAGLKDHERVETSLFLDSFPCLDINDYTGRLAGEYLSRYKKSHGLTLADAMVAACSKIYNLQLWTLNRKHYPMLSKDDFIV